MEKTYNRTYKLIHNDRPDRYYEMDYTADFETHFRPLQQIEGYNPQYIDPDYSIDPYLDTYLYDQQTFRNNSSNVRTTHQLTMMMTLKSQTIDYVRPLLDYGSQINKSTIWKK